ncbi:MAG TPA: sigma-70 family RNA polymerase sigma factor [Salinivirgaceae bacterium]|nr:sigma-70 family RNA polymerase sigma factor [Salinivirgaceae bacterium]
MEVNPNFSEKAQEDFNLVQRAVQGDEKAFAALWERYRDPIYFMLLKMVNNPIDAEDLTIEAFGKAFKNIHRYSPKFAFSTWLFRIASNNCIDFLRKRKEQNQIVTSNKPSTLDSKDKDRKLSQIEDPENDPEEELIFEQKSALIRNIVNNLKPRYRKLIELRYFEEKSYIEIAEILNLPIGTVKAQLFRAKELLYNILKDKTQNF